MYWGRLVKIDTALNPKKHGRNTNMRRSSKREAVACDVESLVFTVCSHDKRGEVDRCKLPYIPQKAINCMLVTHTKYKYPAIVWQYPFYLMFKRPTCATTRPDP